MCPFSTQSATFSGQEVMGQVRIIYYNLGLIVVVLSIISYDNTVLTNAEIWEQASCEVKAELRRRGQKDKKVELKLKYHRWYI